MPTKKFLIGSLCLSSALALTACISDDDTDSLEDTFGVAPSSSSVKGYSSSVWRSSSSVASSSSVQSSSSVKSSSSSAVSSSSVKSSSSSAASSSSNAVSSSSVEAIPLSEFDSLFLAETEGIDCVAGDTLASKVQGVVYRCKENSEGKGEWQRPYLDYTAKSCGQMDNWYGDDGVYRINTGCDIGFENSGYWEEGLSDSAAGGKSFITWPVPKGNGYVGGEESLDPIIDECSGLCGEFTLDKGTLTYNPFVSVGFSMGGEDDNGTPSLVDVSNWDQICVAYSSDLSIVLEMDFGEYIDYAVGYDQPFASLAKSATGITKTISWSKFAQAGWGVQSGGKKISGEQGAKMLSGLRFKFQGASGTTGKFNIMALGKDACNFATGAE